MLFSFVENRKIFFANTRIHYRLSEYSDLAKLISLKIIEKYESPSGNFIKTLSWRSRIKRGISNSLKFNFRLFCAVNTSRILQAVHLENCGYVKLSENWRKNKIIVTKSGTKSSTTNEYVYSNLRLFFSRDSYFLYRKVQEINSVSGIKILFKIKLDFLLKLFTENSMRKRQFF